MGRRVANDTTEPLEVDLELFEGRLHQERAWHAKVCTVDNETLTVMSHDGRIEHTGKLEQCSVDTAITAPNRHFTFVVRIHRLLLPPRKLLFSASNNVIRTKFIAAVTKNVASERGPSEQRRPSTLEQLQSVAIGILENAAADAKSVIPCDISVEQVHQHLCELKATFDIMAACTSAEELYARFLDEEHAYSNDASTVNYASTVHQLHPNKFAADKGRRSTPLSLKERVQHCPHLGCSAPLKLEKAYKLHILNLTVKCSQCNGAIMYDTFKLADLIAAHPTFPMTLATGETAQFPLPAMPLDGTWSSFLANYYTAITKAAPTMLAKDIKKLRSLIEGVMRAAASSSLNPTFSLDLVRGMFRQLDFVAKVGRHFEYWSDPVVLGASIVRYERFMKLMEDRRDHVCVPTVDIDLVWHTHQTHHEAYRRYCQAVRGYLIDHDDTVSSSSLRDGYAYTFQLWHTYFDEPYSSFAPDVPLYDCQVHFHVSGAKKKMQTGSYRLPSRDCRYYGVDEAYPTALLDHAAAFLAAPHAHHGNSSGEDDQHFVTVIGTPY
ncbi:hypothetical protein ACHHYP_07250 [Achlya hypogyna]|uniref:Uncharacterized protein n=1 Tax=Achlya hypogyna TaxID=1202772 RepID=A0A1V9ZMC1_ACHHY|nr:hypothetical protein ACHHYP_07250 [Achlya hypogyna]